LRRDALGRIRQLHLQHLGGNSFELAFRYQAKVSGNMRGPSLPFSSSTHDSVSWFYMKTATGEIPAAELVLTQYRGCKDPLYWQQAMRGTIAVSQDTVTFSLQMP
jgi:hypothetical protein